jgi:type I restriction enzyme R subunit
VDQIESLKGNRFAIIIDEAHSSQSGESTKSLKTALTIGNLDDFDTEESTEF